jgi:uncharacterized membrane protein YesL
MRFEKVQAGLDILATAVAVNLLLVLTASPFIALLVLTDPFQSWPLVAAAAVLAAPGLTAAFTVFRQMTSDRVGSDRAGGNPFRSFVRGYRATWTRSALVALAAVGVCIVLLVDARFFADAAYAQAVMVVLVIVGTIVAGIALLALAAIAEDPTIRVRDAARLGAWFGVRRWYLTLLSLGVLVAYAVFFINLPVLALSVMASPALFLAWTNSRYTLRPAFTHDEVAAV